METTSGTCSDPSKTTKAECLYEVWSGVGLAVTDPKYVNPTECEALVQEMPNVDYWGGDGHSWHEYPFGCVRNGITLYYNEESIYDRACDYRVNRPCIQKLGNTWTPIYENIWTDGKLNNLNVLKGMARIGADENNTLNIVTELEQLLTVTANVNELNIMKGVDANLNSTHLKASFRVDSNSRRIESTWSRTKKLESCSFNRQNCHVQ